MYYQNYEDYMQDGFGYRNDMNSINMGNMNTMSNNIMNDMNTMSNMNTMSDMNTMNNMYTMSDMNMNPNTYSVSQEYMQLENMPTNAELENLYPESYRLINPMVIKACEDNTKPITEEVINEMTKKIRANFDGDESVEINVRTDLKNGDVVNPRMKEKTRETRAPSFLDDLIRILILRNLIRPQQPIFGPRPRPPFPPRPRPPYPPRPRPPYMRSDDQTNYNLY